MEKRFRSLRIIGTVFKIIAWVTLVLGILGGLVMLGAGVLGGFAGGSAFSNQAAPGLGALAGVGGVLASLAAAVGTVIGAVLSFLVFYASGDAIYLALAIEENTREAAHYLKGGEALPHRV